VKKTVLAFILLVIISAGAFADHPSGLGVGIFTSIMEFDAIMGGGLSVKIPRVPIYWAIEYTMGSAADILGLRGDIYIIDSKLVPKINLNWFLGVGVWGEKSFNVLYDGEDYAAGGLKMPVGLSWQPIPLLEVFLDFAPFICMTSNPDPFFASWSIEGGVRFWFGKKENQADFYHEYSGKDIGLARKPINLRY